MKVSLYSYSEQNGLEFSGGESLPDERAALVLCFGSKEIIGTPGAFHLLKEKFSKATIALCSTAGEIVNDRVMDNSLSITAIEFSTTLFKAVSVPVGDGGNSFEAGKFLAATLGEGNPEYILLLSDGGVVNGSDLVRGLNAGNPNKVLITGGLAGDGYLFSQTLVGIDEIPAQGRVGAIAFYGKNFKVGHGSQGGWEIFGPERRVTKSVGNQLFEVGGQSALGLYKKYLGPAAVELPGSALMFPLLVQNDEFDLPLVRTILSIDNDRQSMVFAGDIPQGSRVRFMKANLDRLTEAASQAAVDSLKGMDAMPSFALLVSCVGRKLVFKSRIEDEVEAIYDVFGGKTPMAGFYSYGEISPAGDELSCQLHNQTMTITTFYEKE